MNAIERLTKRTAGASSQATSLTWSILPASAGLK
jgi:hypothetical protein